ncbi:MAG TPA: TRAM domain-containing protein [Acidobacteriota bacterium]|nr:TRAM domain-containing protein [Acidobacteriota bacterium]
MQQVQRFNRDFNNRDRSFDSNREAPVKVGDELDVTIEGVGEKGDGFTRKDGFVLFVPNVQKGDNVKIKVNKVLRKVGFAEVVGASAAAPAPAPAPEKPQDSEEF